MSVSGITLLRIIQFVPLLLFVLTYFEVKLSVAQNIQKQNNIGTQLRAKGVKIVKKVTKTVTPITSAHEYHLKIIAKTGQSLDDSKPIISLGVGPSINNFGNIAFSALEESEESRRIFLVKNDEFHRNYFAPTNLPGHLLQVNDSDQIAYWAQFHIDPNLNTFILRLDSDNSGPIIAVGSPFPQWETPFLYVNPYITMSNNGRVLFVGDLRGSISLTVLASRSSGSDAFEMSSRKLTGLPVMYPMLSDNDRTIVRGGKDEKAPIVVFLDETLNEMNAVGLAQTPDFTSMGQKPGISDDGHTFVYMAEHSTLGAGVFFGVLDNNPIPIWHFATVNGPDLNLNFRAGVNRTTSDSDKKYTIVYLNRDANGILGIYATEVDITDISNVQFSGQFLITQAGQTIPGLEGIVKNLNIYDPVNNLGEIVFWVETELGNQAIIHAIREQVIYLDWENSISKKIYPKPIEDDSGQLLFHEIKIEEGEMPILDSFPIDKRARILEHARDIFRESDISIPVLEYDAKEKRIDQNVYVRFTTALPFFKRIWTCANNRKVPLDSVFLRGRALLTKPFENRFNKPGGGEVAIFIDFDSNDGINGVSIEDEKGIAEVIAHEAGHIFGLRHINPESASSLEVMDSEFTGFVNNQIENFSKSIAPIVEPANSSFLEKYGYDCLASLVRITEPDGQIEEVFHNPSYHLLRWVVGESHESLITRDILPGNYDRKDFILKKYGFMFKQIISANTLYDLTVLGYSTFSITEGASILASFESIESGESLDLDLIFDANESLRIIASSTQSGPWDLFFIATDSRNLSLTPEILAIGALEGTIVKIAHDTEEFIEYGSYSATIELSTPVHIKEIDGNFPSEYSLEQNYPNPFNPDTIIRYRILKETNVKLTIYNILGQKVITLINERHQAGTYEIKWDGSDNTGYRMASGIYLYRLETPEFTETKKLALIH